MKEELKPNHGVINTFANVKGGSNMTGTYAACLHTNQSQSYLNHLVSCIPTIKMITAEFT